MNRSIAACLALAFVLGPGAAEAGAQASFAVVPERAASAILTLPDADDVVALRYGETPEAQFAEVTEWAPTAAGLLVYGPLDAAVMPLFFRASYASGAELVIGQRAIAGGLKRNLRDLGGYVTADGQRVRPGLLYRSGNLGGLSDSERKLLGTLKIRSLCDFRTQAEIDETPNPALGFRAVPGCTDGSTADITEQMEQLKKLAAAGTAVDWHAVMEHSYRGMGSRYAAQLRAMFTELGREDALPLLFRCTGGKDRTGLAAAILLLTLGVPEETVVADYSMTALYAVDGFDSAVFPRELIENPAMAGSPPEYIRAALDAIRVEHGSIEAYVRGELGMSSEDIDRLRARVLAPAP